MALTVKNQTDGHVFGNWQWSCVVESAFKLSKFVYFTYFVLVFERKQKKLLFQEVIFGLENQFDLVM